MAGHEFFSFEILQIRIDAAFAERKRFAGLSFDRPDNVVTIHFATGKELEDEQFGHAIQKTWIYLTHYADWDTSWLKVCQASNCEASCVKAASQTRDRAYGCASPT